MVKKYLHQYAAVVWLPYTKTNIHQLEMIQSKAARFVLNNYSRYSSITEMLNELEWKSLEKRRNETILFMFHKIINQYVDVCYDHIGPCTFPPPIIQLRARSAYNLSVLAIGIKAIGIHQFQFPINFMLIMLVNICNVQSTNRPGNRLEI